MASARWTELVSRSRDSEARLRRAIEAASSTPAHPAVDDVPVAQPDIEYDSVDLDERRRPAWVRDYRVVSFDDLSDPPSLDSIHARKSMNAWVASVVRQEEPTHVEVLIGRLCA